MELSVTEAKARLTELVRRAEAGEEVLLTRHGQPAVKLTPATQRPDAEKRRAAIAAARSAAESRRADGPDAARSQDFLYDDSGLPG